MLWSGLKSICHIIRLRHHIWVQILGDCSYKCTYLVPKATIRYTENVQVKKTLQEKKL